MALVPSGRVKAMEAQTLPSFADYNTELREVIAQFQAADAQPKPGVTQETIGAGQGDAGQQPGVSPAAQPQQQQQQQMDQPEPVDGMIPSEGAGTMSEDQKQEEEGSGSQPGSLEDVVYNALTTLGIQHREWATKKESLFQEKVELNTSVRSGFYLLPRFTQNQKVPFEEAQKIAHQIATQFGLQSSIVNQGKWYKVDYKTVQQNDQGQHGSSFDAIPVKSKGNKAAGTLEAMLKASREEFYEKMKLANRTENK